MDDATKLYLKSKRNFQAARLCHNAKHNDASINRSYYACAQACSAFLEKRNSLPDRNKRNHEVIRSTFIKQWSEHYGKAPILENSPTQLFYLRYNADYTYETTSSKEAMHAYQLASQFLNQLYSKDLIP